MLEGMAEFKMMRGVEMTQLTLDIPESAFATWLNDANVFLYHSVASKNDAL